MKKILIMISCFILNACIEAPYQPNNNQNNAYNNATQQNINYNAGYNAPQTAYVPATASVPATYEQLPANAYATPQTVQPVQYKQPYHIPL